METHSLSEECRRRVAAVGQTYRVFYLGSFGVVGECRNARFASNIATHLMPCRTLSMGDPCVRQLRWTHGWVSRCRRHSHATASGALADGKPTRNGRVHLPYTSTTVDPRPRETRII